ncbi:MAG: hypothetical protein CSA66_06880 [Proteobacteria bacterium]|nr:MAG: hypothetical protein CSA66_06880 [Pseudomonadota bacterium]
MAPDDTPTMRAALFDTSCAGGQGGAMVETDKNRTLFLGVIAAVLVGLLFYAMRPVVLPIVLATFFALMVRPVHRWLKRYVPSALSVTLLTASIGAVLFAIPVMLAANIQAILDKLPEYRPRIQAIFDEVTRVAERQFDVDLSDLHITSADAMDSLLSVLSTSVEGAAAFLGTVVLVLFTMIFVLSETEIARAKLALALDPANERKVMDSVHSMREAMTRYIATKTLISFLSGLSAGLFTWALDVDFPFVWGVLTFMLYYIPNVGATIAVVPPTLIALVQFDSPTQGVVVLASLGVSFNLIGNVLEPRLMGRTLSISPLVVFISLIFWGWYWGFIGVILSVPLTVTVKIVCEHIDALRPIAIMLSDDPEDYRVRPGPPPG